MATSTITRLEHLPPPPPGFKYLELRTAYGPVYRTVSLAPPRPARADEIPIIDLGRLKGDLAQRKDLAVEITNAASKTGFFYVKNHGISDQVINAALDQAKVFFAQPVPQKEMVSKSKSAYFNGWAAMGSVRASPSEGIDHREAFAWRYAPQYDPDPKDPDKVPNEVRPYIRGEEYVWEGTSHLPGFKDACIKYWQECLTLSRQLVRIFALGLNVDEHHFDALTTYPGSDGILNYYPASTPEQLKQAADTSKRDDTVGLGSHTDLQCFTLLWQDSVGGLQILTPDTGEWVEAKPERDTLVVNIGDFLQRLSNDRFVSTVHRVFNRAPLHRYSMPFFFGFNFNESCGVLDSCVSHDRPARYEPISCGDWCQLRFQQSDNIQLDAAAASSDSAAAAASKA